MAPLFWQLTIWIGGTVIHGQSERLNRGDVLVLFGLGGEVLGFLQLEKHILYRVPGSDLLPQLGIVSGTSCVHHVIATQTSTMQR